MEQAMMDYHEVDIGSVGLIPERLAKKYSLLAAGISEGELVVFTAGEPGAFVLEEVRRHTGLRVRLVGREGESLRRAIRYHYAELSARRAMESAALTAAGETVELLDSLIRRAIAVRASDIHIEPYERQTLVRMRVDGVIGDYGTLPPALHPSLIARVKVLSGLDITERRLPQDGHFRQETEEGAVNIRTSVLPTVFGEKAVLRLLTAGQVEDHPERFSMDEETYRRFLPLLSAQNGILYLTGPTGSGKSTTLYMILEHLAKGHVNISTIEDPVEKNLCRVNQTQVNPAAGLTFEMGLRAILRQDPDIIMVGETRDKETAEISVRSAITGHLVLSTLHTNSAASSILRLTDMGVEPYLVASALMGVVAQRLVRKTCPGCGVEEAATEAERSFWGMDLVTVRRGKGCRLCGGTGCRGRTAIHELLVVDRSIRRMIAQGRPEEDIEAWAQKEQGMKTLRQQAAELVRRRLAAPEEAMRAVSFE